MSRIIKFRAWHKDMRVMYHKPGWTLSAGVLGTSPKPYPSNYELMQWTGLEDKSGHEIYEGDIVVSSNPHFRGIVTWFKDLPGFMIFANKATEFSVLRGEWEVIGNIYENPELLKKDENQ